MTRMHARHARVEGGLGLPYGGCVELGREGEGTNGEGRTLASLPTPPPPLNINDFLYNIKAPATVQLLRPSRLLFAAAAAASSSRCPVRTAPVPGPGPVVRRYTSPASHARASSIHLRTRENEYFSMALTDTPHRVAGLG